MSDDRQAISGVDWRYRVVTTMSEDAKLPSGRMVRKGDPVSVTTFIKHGSEVLAIGDPSAPALFLSQSHKAYEQALQIHPFVGTLPGGGERAVSAKVYDYLECMMTAVLFAFSALEAFANEQIPEDFTHETHKPSSKILVAYKKQSIERYVSLDEKLATVLPKAASKPSPKRLPIWSDYVLLRRLRDRFVHLKSTDRAHSKVGSPYPGSIWSELLAPKQPDYPLIAKKMMLHFCEEGDTHWLKCCPF